MLPELFSGLLLVVFAQGLFVGHSSLAFQKSWFVWGILPKNLKWVGKGSEISGQVQKPGYTGEVELHHFDFYHDLPFRV
jgi:hypothetical protein